MRAFRPVLCPVPNSWFKQTPAREREPKQNNVVSERSNQWNTIFSSSVAHVDLRLFRLIKTHYLTNIPLL
jgi:hypothetical protein